MPQLTRRSVLLLGGVASLTALAVPAPASAAGTASLGHPAIAARSAFADAIGSNVTATAGQHRFRLRLLSILDLGPAGQYEPERCFNLVFRASGTGAMPDGIYRLRSTRFPATTLLLTGIGPAANNQFQALVNRSS